MSDKKYYKTTITLEVLSEEPIPSWMEAKDVLNEMDNGDFVGVTNEAAPKELTGKQMADELVKFGSKPEFFSLNEDGEEV